jgi:lysophospholipase L1-like esterase
MPNPFAPDSLSPSGARLSSGDTERRMVVLGDSIVAGWGLPSGASYPALLERQLTKGMPPGQHWRIINAGAPGETVLQGLARFAQDVAAHRPDLVLIAFGRNDAALRRTRYDAQRERLWRATHDAAARWRLRVERLAGLALRPFRRRLGAILNEPVHAAQPRVTEACFVAVLRALVERTRQCGARTALVTIWPLDTLRLPPAQVRAYARYDALIAQVAQEAGALLLDRPKLTAPMPADLFLDDGLHLTAAGQTWLAEAILQRLREHHVIHLEEQPGDR